MRTITRQQLQESIEAGIVVAASGFNFGRERLRAVGRTATKVAIGDYIHDETGVGCPVTQAFPHGLAHVKGDVKFALAFDRHMRAALGLPRDAVVAVEVVG